MELVKSDRGLDLQINGKMYTILGDNICSMINDCANIVDRQRIIDSSTGAEDRTVEFLPYANYSYNVNFLGHLGKQFAVSSRNIKQNEEIFVAYGRYVL
jgi:hypothetical protein